MRDHKGFTLLEMLLYVAILSIVAVLFVGILSTGTRVQLQETAANEVSNQLNFAIQTIQRLVRDSSAIVVTNANPCADSSSSSGSGDTDISPGTPQSCLKLRMHDDPRDPIFIWTDTTSGTVKIQQGTNKLGTNPPQDLTTNKVVVPSNGLTFTKLINYPGHDAVQINLTLNYNTANAQSQVSRNLVTAIGRVSEATFDTTLTPTTNNSGSSDIGLGSQFWRNLYLSGGFNVVDGKIYEPSNFDASTTVNNNRGTMMVFAPANSLCGDSLGVTGICTYHTGHCEKVVTFQTSQQSGSIGGKYALCTDIVTEGGFCFCD